MASQNLNYITHILIKSYGTTTITRLTTLIKPLNTTITTYTTFLVTNTAIYKKNKKGENLYICRFNS